MRAIGEGWEATLPGSDPYHVESMIEAQRLLLLESVNAGADAFRRGESCVPPELVRDVTAKATTPAP